MDAAGAPSILTPEALASRLRRAGLRWTRPRRIVYAALAGLGGHRSADEVFAAMSRRGELVSRMSVYNTLTTLASAGVILRADVGPGRALFEANDAWHHHFVCRRCRRIFDVPCVKGRKPCLRLSARVGEADEAQIIFRGLCSGCAGRKKVRGS